MRFRLVGRNDRILEMNVRVLFLGPQAGMTRSAHHRLDRRQESFTLSFSTHDQVENDVKDTVYQIRLRMTLRCLNDT